MAQVKYICTGGCGGEVTEAEYKEGKTVCAAEDCPRHGQPLQKRVGVLTHFYDRISVGIVALETPINVGDQIRVSGPKTDFTQGVESMQVKHQNIEQAKAGDEVGIKVENPVREGDLVLLVG